MQLAIGLSSQEIRSKTHYIHRLKLHRTDPQGRKLEGFLQAHAGDKGWRGDEYLYQCLEALRTQYTATLVTHIMSKNIYSKSVNMLWVWGYSKE